MVLLQRRLDVLWLWFNCIDVSISLGTHDHAGCIHLWESMGMVEWEYQAMVKDRCCWRKTVTGTVKARDEEQAERLVKIIPNFISLTKLQKKV